MALSVGGRSNQVLKAGDIVSELKFHASSIPELIRKRFIIPWTEIVPNNKEVLKIAIVTAVWKRPEVFEMFARGIKELYKINNLEIVTIVSGSEGAESRRMVEFNRFKYIEIPNDPLAAKVNATTYAAQFENVDYVLCLGSDDVVSVDCMKYYIECMRIGYDFIGVTDFYFYDTDSQKSAYWGGYREANRKGNTCGAGRLISARLMKLWDWMPWENKHSKILDNSMQEKLKSTPHSSHIFSLKEKGLFALDIKSSTNMTPFKLWDNTEYINSDIILENFAHVKLSE